VGKLLENNINRVGIPFATLNIRNQPRGCWLTYETGKQDKNKQDNPVTPDINH
jgi:hypothetical protein